jgi:hypothetical protein
MNIIRCGDGFEEGQAKIAEIEHMDTLIVFETPHRRHKQYGCDEVVIGTFFLVCYFESSFFSIPSESIFSSGVLSIVSTPQEITSNLVIERTLSKFFIQMNTGNEELSIRIE